MKITPSQKRQLASLFRKHHVELAYLFGSAVTGKMRHDSDVDIAVLLPETLSSDKRFDIRLKLMGECEKIFKKNIDLVVLNDISSLFFKYIIIREGKPIFMESDVRHAEFESRIFGLYFDFRHSWDCLISTIPDGDFNKFTGEMFHVPKKYF